MNDILVIKKFEQNPENYKILNPSDIFERLEKLGITAISITDGDIVNFVQKNIKFKEQYNDEQNPVVLVNNMFDQTLTINPEWYLKHQKIATELINYVAKHNKEKEMTITDKGMIDDKLIDSLCENTNIETVYLARFSDNPYSLTKDHYLKFKESSITSVRTSSVDKDLEDTFDKLIYYNEHKHLIQNSRYSDIQQFDKITIRSELTEKDLENFKYLRKENVLEFTIETIPEIKKAIGRLKALGLNNKIVISVKDKKQFNSIMYKLDIPEYDQLYIFDSKSYDQTLFSLYKINESILQTLVAGAESLSPLEKFIYVYNITKKYKKYKENEEDRGKARNLYDILENEYMVCVGFSKMLEDLCSRLNIPCIGYSVTVDTSYDREKNDPQKQVVAEQEGHARNLVYIKDDKYGIDGYYVSDATWDNDMEKDLYNHMLMTVDEMNSTRRYNWFSTSNPKELFAAKSIDEFYQILNFVMSRNNPPELNFYFRSLVMDIEAIDPEFVGKLKEKYPYLNEIFWKQDNINDLIEDLSVYIVEKNNNKVSGRVLIEAIKNVYQNAYGYREEEIEPELMKTVEDNYENSSKNFPIRYRENEDKNEIIMNEENKWERKTR